MSEFNFYPYVNQADVDRVKKIVDDIAPGLKLSRYSFNPKEKRVIDVGIMIPVKGNGELIEKFVSMGFEKGHKRRRETKYPWDTYKGYLYSVELVFRLPEPPQEGE